MSKLNCIDGSNSRKYELCVKELEFLLMCHQQSECESTVVIICIFPTILCEHFDYLRIISTI